MARRAHSSTHPAWLAVALAVILLFAGGGYLIYSQLSDPFRTFSQLPVEAYLQNANSLRGNRYRVDVTVANQLGWTPEKGRLYSMDLDNSQEVLPLLIPAELNSVNLQKGQRFTIEVEVIDRGILEVKRLRKA